MVVGLSIAGIWSDFGLVVIAILLSVLLIVLPLWVAWKILGGICSPMTKIRLTPWAKRLKILWTVGFFLSFILFGVTFGSIRERLRVNLKTQKMLNDAGATDDAFWGPYS